MDRAEKLKKHLDETNEEHRKKPGAMGVNGKSTGGAGKGKCVESHDNWLLAAELTISAETMTMRWMRIRRSYEEHCQEQY